MSVVPQQPLTVQPQGVPVMMQPQIANPVIVQQPTVPTNAVFVQQPTVPAAFGKGQRDWSSGLCACCDDVSSCLCVCCFPFCFEMYLASKMDESCCLPCCVIESLATMRAHFRGKHGIRGSIINDCCTALFCCPFALCQLSREIDKTKNPGFVQPAPGFAATHVMMR